MTKRDARCALSVFAITLLMFARLVLCDFTWWDDPQTIHHNPLLNPPTWAALGHYWSAMGPASPMGLYVPVTYTLWWLLASVAQMPATVDNIRLNPMVFHAFNVLVHALSATLVFVILSKLLTPSPGTPGEGWGEGDFEPSATFDDRNHPHPHPLPEYRERRPEKHVFHSLAGALLFAIHPVQVETVAWASGTKDLLCGLFTLVAVDRFICFARRCRRFDLVAAFLAVLLAMLSKPTAVIAPLLLLTIGHFALRRSPRRLVKEFWPMLLLMVPCAIVARWSQPATFSSPEPLLARPLVAADAVTFYVGKLIWPVHLSPDYGRSPASLLQAGTLYSGGVISLFVIMLLTAIAWRSRRLSLALLLFLVPLLPVLGLQPFLYQYHSTVTDHYLYLPMFGVGLLLAITCARIPKILVVSMLVLLGGRTLMRQPAWQNTRTLFTAAVADDPKTFGNFDMLGFTYALDASRAARTGDAELERRAAASAIDNYTKAIDLNPLDVPARDNLARVELNLGNRDAAIEQMNQIIALQPKLPPDLRANSIDLQRRLREYSGD